MSFCSSASDSQDDNESFGTLLNITDDQLIALGSRIHELVSKVKTSSYGGHLVQALSGSYNLIRVIQLDGTKMVIRIPRIGQSGDLQQPAKAALESHVYTLQYIKAHTIIPVPEILHYDTTANNEIGAPYIAMSYISGRTVSRLWFEDSGPTPLEERRQNILRQLAKSISQLNMYRFDKIGSLIPNDLGDGHQIGPCFDFEEADDESLRITSSGPHPDTISFLKQYWAPTNEGSSFGIGAAKVLEEILPLMPVHDSTYALALPDFDSQNIMADEQGNITGIIDWDNAQTVPDFMGCLRYPSWITRDWDPLMYGWPHFVDTENSPDELHKYRGYYLEEMKQALISQGVKDYRLTEKSHIFEAFWIAASSGMNRTRICEKLVVEARNKLSEAGMSCDLDENGLSVLDDIGDEYIEDQDWEDLRNGLEALFSLQT